MPFLKAAPLPNTNSTCQLFVKREVTSCLVIRDSRAAVETGSFGKAIPSARESERADENRGPGLGGEASRGVWRQKEEEAEPTVGEGARDPLQALCWKQESVCVKTR